MSKGSQKSKNEEESKSPIPILQDYFRTPLESEDTDSNSSKHRGTWDSEESSKQTSSSSWRWSFLKILVIAKSKMQPLSIRSYDLDSPSNSFSLSELQFATSNFNPENLIGKGGYAEVYKGRLKDGRIVAIKRLVKGTYVTRTLQKYGVSVSDTYPSRRVGYVFLQKSVVFLQKIAVSVSDTYPCRRVGIRIRVTQKGTAEEKAADFLAELGIMAHVNHPNAAKLIGYGADGGMHLVLHYSHLGSLASHLHGSNPKLRWNLRYKVALGVAHGLAYLHQHCQRRIIHRDIKPANILLSADFQPQICDFGLAKWLPEKWSHLTISKFEGTFGYLAPEYLMHGIVDEKTDVFAFGVLLLELVTGRRALDCSHHSLVLWAKPLLKKGSLKELIDSSLMEKYDCRQMNLIFLAASLCIQRSSIRRPSMPQVVQLLKGNLSSLDWKIIPKPSFWRKYNDDGVVHKGRS